MRTMSVSKQLGEGYVSFSFYKADIEWLLAALANPLYKSSNMLAVIAEEWRVSWAHAFLSAPFQTVSESIKKLQAGGQDMILFRPDEDRLDVICVHRQLGAFNNLLLFAEMWTASPYCRDYLAEIMDLPADEGTLEGAMLEEHADLLKRGFARMRTILASV